MTNYIVYAYKVFESPPTYRYETLGYYRCESRSKAIETWREENPSKAVVLDSSSNRVKLVALVEPAGI